MASVDIYQMTTKDTNHKVAPVTIFDAVVNPLNKKTLDQEFEDMVGAKDESVAVDDADATLVTTALRKTEQVLTQAEKKQVRTNINAADADDLIQLSETVSENKTNTDAKLSELGSIVGHIYSFFELGSYAYKDENTQPTKGDNGNRIRTSIPLLMNKGDYIKSKGNSRFFVIYSFNEKYYNSGWVSDEFRFDLDSECYIVVENTQGDVIDSIDNVLIDIDIYCSRLNENLKEEIRLCSTNASKIELQISDKFVELGNTNRHIGFISSELTWTQIGSSDYKYIVVDVSLYKSQRIQVKGIESRLFFTFAKSYNETRVRQGGAIDVCNGEVARREKPGVYTIPYDCNYLIICSNIPKNDFLHEISVSIKGEGKSVNERLEDIEDSLTLRNSEIVDLQFEVGGVYGNNALEDKNTTQALRTPIIANLLNHDLLIKINEGYEFEVFESDGENSDKSVVSVKGNRHRFFPILRNNIRIVLYRTDRASMTLDDVVASGISLSHRATRDKQDKYDVIVAAKNSSNDEKACADLICDGYNDEVEIELAANYYYGFRHECNVLLMHGQYNIDEFRQRFNASNEASTCQYAVMCGMFDDGFHYFVNIEGKYYGHNPDDSATLINVTNAGVLTLSESLDNVVFGSPRSGEDRMGIHYLQYALSIEKMLIYTNGARKKIIAIDGIGASRMNVEKCHIWSEWALRNLKLDVNPPIKGSIGIRGTCGSCYGVGQKISNNSIVGYYEGIALTGEHFVLQDNLQHHCYYGFTIGNYTTPKGTAMEHPNVFIGNSVEQCVYMGLLNRYGATEDEVVDKPSQTLIYIGGSVEGAWTDSNGNEVLMKPIKEVCKGVYKGRMESDALYGEYANSLFEEGSGKHIVQTIW